MSQMKPNCTSEAGNLRPVYAKSRRYQIHCHSVERDAAREVNGKLEIYAFVGNEYGVRYEVGGS
jgi:hypothetical protein